MHAIPVIRHTLGIQQRVIQHGSSLREKGERERESTIDARHGCNGFAGKPPRRGCTEDAAPHSVKSISTCRLINEKPAAFA